MRPLVLPRAEVPPSPAAEIARFRRIRGGVLALSGFLSMVVVAVPIYNTVSDRHERLHEAEIQSRSLARALEQHATRLFEGTGQFLIDIRKEVEAKGGLAQADYGRLRELLRSERAHDRATRTAYLVDPYGEPVVTSAQGTADNIYERPDFRIHRLLADRGITVSAPFQNLESRWVLPISIRMDDHKGFLAGVAVIELDVEYLIDFYRSLDLDKDTAVGLAQPDGTFFARYPDFEQVAGKARPSAALAAMQGIEGSITAVSPVDGIERIAAYRKVQGQPLLVFLAVSKEHLLAPWLGQTAVRLALTLGLLGFLGAVTWITLQRLDEVRGLHETLEQRVRKRTEELAEANAELEAFSYSVSHDLRAPLRHLCQYAHLLRDAGTGPRDFSAPELTERIYERSRYMGELVDALLELSRIGRTPLKREVLELSEMAHELVAEMRVADPERRVEAVVEPGLRVSADRTLVQTLLQNLLDNAWKYTSRNPDAHIRFGAETIAGERVFAVRDNGVGFDPQYMSNLFGAFQRLHSTSEFEGTGIGLATARRIVQRHGGRIWAEAVPGKSATFLFTLPPG
jgi:signal transduction histidine kinase